MKPIEFCLSSIPDDDLPPLIQWFGGNVDKYEPLCVWLGELLANEACRRIDGSGDKVLAFHLPEHWDDGAVATALEGITVLSFAQGISSTTGLLIDKVTIHVAAEAAGRLRERHQKACN